ncbi:SDR family oxidoreductase [Vitiosangium sp. GDMCC 1.1324]|uniref:SDR family NAD(P)-dependent oxidoreductase n=1 Tax=Vitiosangium sp. (strain GDMCC 1.1324) TaxID=2138576 RepID=UPI000D35439B|nr:SDR family oxidoreductase [Vitiosangium sp. GDMCC 1.1324]PTL76288.1 oxidoreductase [Vitiosangium sp. GDMCC 1.1324]
MYDFAEKTVMVTGGSMGIGAAFAQELARRRARLVLVARSAERLRTLAEDLTKTHGVRVDVVAEDLARPGAAKRVLEAVRAKGLVIDVLINNAGFGMYGPFEELPLETQREEIDLNIGALVELTHVFLPDLERRQGGVIQVASTAAFQPVPFMAVYAASKAFVLSFSEALWAEYRERGVRVLALCPGATDTPFFARAGEAAAFGRKASAEDVVRVGLAAFDANRSHVVHGFGNYFTALMSRWATREFTARLSAKLMRPKPLLVATGRSGSSP